MRAAPHPEYAVNASNYRHWDEPVRLYVDDCMKGAKARAARTSTCAGSPRWSAECLPHPAPRRGLPLPGDRRRGYHQGRLRLVYEANPIAFLMEQAGGAATETVEPHPRPRARALHQRIPLVFGSAREVERIARYHVDPSARRARAAVRQSRPLPRLIGARAMSARHPIISITGSSGAGTTSVKRIFEQIFRREKIKAAFVEGDAFHAYDRQAMKDKGCRGGEEGQPQLHPLQRRGQRARNPRGGVR